MKTVYTILLCLLCSSYGYSQNGINYKAIIKDDLGNVITNDLIQIQFEIRQNSETGTDVKTEVSGIYFLNAGQEVWVNLRNFSSGTVNVDGTGSWFEGYKID